MYKLIRPALFSFDPEKIHEFAFSSIRAGMKIPGVSHIAHQLYGKVDASLSREIFGLTFPSPVGLAAGFDKNAYLVDEMEQLGFGFVEIGTLTPKPQPGNEKPRLFRLPADQALINRMGFNNEGVGQAVERLKRRKSNIIVGGNIGKNKVTPNEEAVKDYEYCFERLFDYVDYFTVNVSSPNTPGLRELQEKEPLLRLLDSVQALNQAKAKPKPLLLKIAPDLTNEQLDDIVDIAFKTQLSGLIATNTTIDRGGLKTAQSTIAAIGNGGLSGRPLRERATAIIRYLVEKTERKVPVIGVGGIHTPEDALEKLAAGASLLQVYTGFVYEGPAFISNINKAIVRATKVHE